MSQPGHIARVGPRFEPRPMFLRSNKIQEQLPIRSLASTFSAVSLQVSAAIHNKKASSSGNSLRLGMTQGKFSKDEIDRFILNEIDSVPHMEALLILRSVRPRPMSFEDVAAKLYIPPETALTVLQDLARKNLTQTSNDGRSFAYDSTDRDLLIAEVELTYRRELVRVANLIHSKASNAVRDFARAFRITKDEK